MLGSGGLFRQENVEKRRILSVREWAELCGKADFRAPGVNDVGLHARANVQAKATRRRKKARDAEAAEPETEGAINEEATDEHMVVDEKCDENLKLSLTSPRCNPEIAISADIPLPPESIEAEDEKEIGSGPRSPSSGDEGKRKAKSKTSAHTRENREANLADHAARDAEFLKSFDPHSDWLPPNTSASDYTLDFCRQLERQYWRNCGLGRPAWYGADTQGESLVDLPLFSV
jgi:hypothetical protein